MMNQHLELESLARLVEEAPSPAEAEHLRACDLCAQEIDSLRRQTRELGSLAPITPQPAAWARLEASLRQQRLIGARDDSPISLDARRAARAPAWRANPLRSNLLRIAAGLVLFLGGGVAGAMLGPRLSLPTTGAVFSALSPGESERVHEAAVERAAAALEDAELAYVEALARYTELVGVEQANDALLRLATLETIVHTTATALGESPADPVLNGYHFTAVAQRDAMLRQIAMAVDGPWF